MIKDTPFRSCVMAVVALVPLAGCNLLLGVDDLVQGGEDAAAADIDANIDAPPGSVRIRFVSVVRDFPSGAVDVYIGDETSARVTALRNASDYIVMDPGVTTIALREQGQVGGAPIQQLTNLAFQGDTSVTAVIAGVHASQAPDERVRLLPFVEDYAQPGAGQAQVRFVNAVTEFEGFGIDLGLDGESTPEIAGLGRYASTNAAGMPVTVTAGQGLRMGLVVGGATVAPLAPTGFAVGEGCFVIFSGRLAAAWGSPEALVGMTLCASRPPRIDGLGAEIALAHVVSDGTTCSVTGLGDGTTLIPSLALRQFGRTWAIENAVAEVTLNCSGQSALVPLESDAAINGPRQLALVGGSLPSSPALATFPAVTVPSTGSRHAYFVNLSADFVEQSACRTSVDGTVLGSLVGAQVIGPDFGQSSSTLSAGSHTIMFGLATTVTFPVSITGSGGATVFVLEGAFTPEGSQRPLRLTPVDVSVWPPVAGSPISPI